MMGEASLQVDDHDITGPKVQLHLENKGQMKNTLSITKLSGIVT